MKISGGFLLLFALAPLCLSAVVPAQDLGKEDCNIYKKFPVSAIPCPITYFPVCGSDYMTYGNGCHLCIENLKTNGKVTYLHDGIC